MAAPSGVVETEDSSKVAHCTWVYSRVDLARPVLCLPTKDKYTTAVRFSPQLYTLRMPKKTAIKPGDEQPWVAAKSLFALPYRQVYAVATQNAIMFYDTQQVAPFGRVSNVHYTGLTDLAWSPCGNILLASSSDGYCSIVSFAPGEIGELYTEETSAEKTVESTKALISDEKAKVANEELTNVVKENKSNAKRLQFITLSSPKANKKINRVDIADGKESGKMEMNLDSEDLGVERMDTEDNDLLLVLEETQPEPPKVAAAGVPAATAGAPQLCGGGASAAVETKKRVPLTTIVAGPNAHPGPGAGATPEKAKGKGRRVDLITLSSPKTKT